MSSETWVWSEFSRSVWKTEQIGISQIIKGNELEDAVFKIFNDINVNVQLRDTEACHRFGKPD